MLRHEAVKSYAYYMLKDKWSSYQWIYFQFHELWSEKIKRIHDQKPWNHVENHRKNKSYVVIKEKEAFPHWIFIKQDNHEIISWNKRFKNQTDFSMM